MLCSSPRICISHCGTACSKSGSARRGIVAADIFLQNAIAFVFEFVVNADFRGVVAAHGQLFQVAEKADLRDIDHLMVVGKYGENRYALFGASGHEGFSVVMLAHKIDQT